MSTLLIKNQRIVFHNKINSITRNRAIRVEIWARNKEQRLKVIDSAPIIMI